MKFERLTELENFIKNKKLFDEYVSLFEIYTGGSSYNFCVQTKTKKYLLKVMCFSDRFIRLKEILKELNILQKIADDNFSQEEKILVMPFIDGKKMSNKDVTDNCVQLLKEQYQKLQLLDAHKIKIPSSESLEDISCEIDEILQREKGWIFQLVSKLFWPSMKENKIEPRGEKVIIHGDFTENNILIDSNRKPYIIDFERVRYGYAVEDWMYLLLQMAGFRKLFGSLSLLKSLSDKFNLPYTKNELLYGVQNFYWRLLLRRLHNNIYRKVSVRKNICLLIILFGYFRVQNFLLQNESIK